jgi:hypothetical protein
MDNHSNPENVSHTVKHPNRTVPAVVEKIIKPPHPQLPEKAQIAVEGAEELYREIRIENTLTDETGNEVRLKEGAKVEITIQADQSETEPKKNS